MSADLRPYTGALKRWPAVLELKAGTWNAVAKVTPIGGARGEASADRRFEVSIAWHGPPMEGFARGPQVVDATDLVLVGDVELATAIAMAAIDLIRAGKVPDLRALERRFRG